MAVTRVDGVTSCSQTDVTALRDVLRLSACRLNANRTAGEMFRAAVRAKHSLPHCKSLELSIIFIQRCCSLIHSLSPDSNDHDFFILAPLNYPTVTSVWCRTTCPAITPENVTWCVHIAYLEKNVEVCIRPDVTQTVVITNISCEAELVGLANYLSFPTVSFAYQVAILCHLLP